jgi:hypothetical protein
MIHTAGLELGVLSQGWTFEQPKVYEGYFCPQSSKAGIANLWDSSS